MESYRRKTIRFKPDAGSMVAIDLDNSTEEFTPTLYGLPINESHHGVGFVISKSAKLEKGNSLQVKVGRLHPMIAKIIWTRQIDNDLLRVGLEFED